MGSLEIKLDKNGNKFVEPVFHGNGTVASMVGIVKV